MQREGFPETIDVNYVKLLLIYLRDIIKPKKKQSTKHSLFKENWMLMQWAQEDI